MDASSRRRIESVMLVINPVSGRRQSKRRLYNILDIFSRAGICATVYITQARGDAVRFARDNCFKYDAVVSVGGDGTLSETVSGIMQSGVSVPFGHIPSGSSDDFSGCHGIPHSAEKAAQLIVDGNIHPVDTGVFNGRPFAYIAAFGAFSDLSYTTPQDLKNILGHSAYLLDSLKELQRIKASPMVFTTENGTVSGEFCFGAVCNVTCISGVLKLPKKSVSTDDGLFEIVLARKPDTLADWQTVASSVFSGAFDPEFFEFFRADSVKIETGASVGWSLDGEYESPHREITIVNRPRSLLLLTDEQPSRAAANGSDEKGAYEEK